MAGFNLLKKLAVEFVGIGCGLVSFHSDAAVLPCPCGQRVIGGHHYSRGGVGCQSEGTSVSLLANGGPNLYRGSPLAPVSGAGSGRAREWRHHRYRPYQTSRRPSAMASRGHTAGESSEGRRNLARSSSVVFAGCGVIRSTGFWPCKGGDTACAEEDSNHLCRHCAPNAIHGPNGLGILKNKHSRSGQ